jgi:hypothetical protein
MLAIPLDFVRGSSIAVRVESVALSAAATLTG